MSLVGDALRRARAEGARRRGLAIPPGLGPPIRRSLLGGPAAVVISLVLVAAGAALVTWWLVGRGGEAPTAAATVETVPHEDLAKPASPPAGAATTEKPDATSTRPSPIASPLSGEGAGATEGSPRNAPPADAPEAPAPPPQIAEPAAASSGGVAAAAPSSPDSGHHPAAAAERSFVIDAELGYATLHLDYLVYKPSAPFARINGRDVIVGSIVAGFKVEEIGPDYVRLSDSRGPLTLRVR